MSFFLSTLFCTGALIGLPVAQPRPGLMPESLADFTTKRVADGWKAVESTPDTPKSQSAVVRTPGCLDTLKAQQRVTLRYSWVVVSETPVKAGSDEVIRLDFNTPDCVESEFEITLNPRPLVLALDLSKKQSQPLDGTSIKMTVRTGKQEKKLVVGLQQVVQVHSDEKTPRLLATGYLKRYAPRTFVKVEPQ